MMANTRLKVSCEGILPAKKPHLLSSVLRVGRRAGGMMVGLCIRGRVRGVSGYRFPENLGEHGEAPRVFGLCAYGDADVVREPVAIHRP